MSFIDDQEIERLSASERQVLTDILKELRDHGKSVSYGHLLNEVYEEVPVDPVEFIDSPRYLNYKTQVYNRIKYIAAEIDKPDIHEAWLAAGKGFGKSILSGIIASRAMYRLLCLKNPQSYYGLLPGSEIATINVSVSEKQAKNIVFKAIKEMIGRCEWFRNRNPVIFGQELRFPQKNIVAYSGHSGGNAWLGYNTLVGILDEADKFMDKDGLPIAEQLYGTLKGSLETRWERVFCSV